MAHPPLKFTAGTVPVQDKKGAVSIKQTQKAHSGLNSTPIIKMDDLGLYHSSLKDEIIWESVEKSRDELRVVHGPFLDYYVFWIIVSYYVH